MRGVQIEVTQNSFGSRVRLHSSRPRRRSTRLCLQWAPRTSLVGAAMPVRRYSMRHLYAPLHGGSLCGYLLLVQVPFCDSRHGGHASSGLLGGHRSAVRGGRRPRVGACRPWAPWGLGVQPNLVTRNVRLVHPWYFEPPHVDVFVVGAGLLDRARTCGSPS